MTSNNEIKDWYNTYTRRQTSIGVNLRHYTLIDRAVRAGLRRYHSVLEVGCGIGTLTGLLSGYLKKGSLMATDISDESIEIAKERLSDYKNTQFLVSDMSDFDKKGAFDFIILPDVLEHIPVEQHHQLFSNLSKALKEKGKILINIPHPKYIDYLHENEPEKLQIVDQALSAAILMKDIYEAGLTLVFYESYSIFNRANDYVSILLEKENPEVYADRPKWQIILDKLKLRFKY
ncbi:MAG: hypothetical protein Tsb0034_26780 [Ekhidna sp.]